MRVRDRQDVRVHRDVHREGVEHDVGRHPEAVLGRDLLCHRERPGDALLVVHVRLNVDARLRKHPDEDLCGRRVDGRTRGRREQRRSRNDRRGREHGPAAPPEERSVERGSIHRTPRTLDVRPRRAFIQPPSERTANRPSRRPLPVHTIRGRPSTRHRLLTHLGRKTCRSPFSAAAIGDRSTSASFRASLSGTRDSGRPGRGSPVSLQKVFPGSRRVSTGDALDEVDAVIVATPPTTHADLAMRIARGRQERPRREAHGDHRRPMRGMFVGRPRRAV